MDLITKFNRRGFSENADRNADVRAAALDAGLPAAEAGKCGVAADKHDWITVRRILIATDAYRHERNIREAYYGTC